MIVFLVLLLLILIIITQWWCNKLYKYYVDLGHYSGPIPLPLIGSAHNFKSGEDVITTFQYYQKKHGDNFKLLIGNELRLILTEHKAVEELLTSTKILNKSYEYKFLHRWIGMGLLTAMTENWRKQRKLLTPAFHFSILEQFIDIFNSKSKTLVKKMESYLDGSPFDLFPVIGLCSLDIICETSMGVSIDAQKDSESSYVRNIGNISTIIVERMFSPLKFFDTFYKYTDLFKREFEALKVIHRQTTSVIKQRKEELKNDNEDIGDEDNIGRKKRFAFLDLLLKTKVNGENLPDDYIKDEVDTIMFEGHDTVTSAISFTLYCLGQHPEIQKRVVEELQTILADDKLRSPTYQDLQDTKYLDMVFKESMRVYPPVTLYGRVLDEDTLFGGKMLPKGLSLTVLTHALHYQPDMFPDPEKFDPERFSPENIVNRPPFAYLPFSAGQRNCIGFRYAILTMKATLVAVLRNYEILPVEGHKPILMADVILNSANGLPIRIKKRTF